MIDKICINERRNEWFIKGIIKSEQCSRRGLVVIKSTIQGTMVSLLPECSSINILLIHFNDFKGGHKISRGVRGKIPYIRNVIKKTGVNVS